MKRAGSMGLMKARGRRALAMSHSSSVTVGIDVSDRHSYLCLIDTISGEVLGASRIATSPAAFERRFSSCEPMRIALEAGIPSPRISRLLTEACADDVLLATTRNLTL